MIFGISYFRLAIYAIALAVIGYLGYQYNTGQEAKAQVVALTAERDKAIADYNAYIETREKQDKITSTVSTSYEKATKDIPNEVSSIVAAVPSLRVCKPALQVASASSSASSRSDAANADGSSGAHEELVAEVSTEEPAKIAGEAKACGERLNHLQEWIRQQNQLSSNP